jgi:negative regulator of replication initiation
MTNKNTNGSTTRTPSRKGPRPIQSLAQLREQLLRDAVAKEMKKIDRKIAVEERKRKIAHQRAADATSSLDTLNKLRAEFLRESGLKA